MRMRLLLLLSVMAVAASGGVWAALDGGADAGEPAYVAEHPVAVPESLRTVMVSATMPLPSAHASRLAAMLEHGPMPDEPTMAEVLTDTECAPNKNMISRCRNDVRLPDGRTIMLRHPHNMSKVPCLAPGEHVRLVPVA